MRSCPPVTTDDASCFGASWLRSMQAPLTSHSTRSVKLLFFQKAAAVVVIVEFARSQNYEERREGAYVRDKLNIQANAPSPLLSKKSVQKGGGIFSGAYGMFLKSCICRDECIQLILDIVNSL